MKHIFKLILTVILILNTVTCVNAKTSSAQNAPDNIILVNYNNPIPEGYVDDIELTEVEYGHKLEKTAALNLKAMLKDARAAGLNPVIVSSFRTNKKQQTLHTNQINRQIGYGYSRETAADMARRVVAYPGTSEHEIGLAADIVSSKYTGLDKKQETTAEAKWLMENCADYGFILRYPADKTEITEIIYEPWHYRYVGVKAAKQMKELGFSLEEYTKWIKQRLLREFKDPV